MPSSTLLAISPRCTRRSKLLRSVECTISAACLAESARATQGDSRSECSSRSKNSTKEWPVTFAWKHLSTSCYISSIAPSESRIRKHTLLCPPPRRASRHRTCASCFARVIARSCGAVHPGRRAPTLHTFPPACGFRPLRCLPRSSSWQLIPAPLDRSLKTLLRLPPYVCMCLEKETCAGRSEQQPPRPQAARPTAQAARACRSRPSRWRGPRALGCRPMPVVSRELRLRARAPTAIPKRRRLQETILRCRLQVAPAQSRGA
jgi:hypothetical protein